MYFKTLKTNHTILQGTSVFQASRYSLIENTQSLSGKRKPKGICLAFTWNSHVLLSLTYTYNRTKLVQIAGGQYGRQIVGIQNNPGLKISQKYKRSVTCCVQISVPDRLYTPLTLGDGMRLLLLVLLVLHCFDRFCMWKMLRNSKKILSDGHAKCYGADLAFRLFL